MTGRGGRSTSVIVISATTVCLLLLGVTGFVLYDRSTADVTDDGAAAPRSGWSPTDQQVELSPKDQRFATEIRDFLAEGPKPGAIDMPADERIVRVGKRACELVTAGFGQDLGYDRDKALARRLRERTLDPHLVATAVYKGITYYCPKYAYGG